MGIQLRGYGFTETETGEIERIINAVAPGAAGISSINGQTGAIQLKTVDGEDLIGPGNIDTGTTGVGGGGVSTPFSLSVLYDLDFRYYSTIHHTTANDVYTKNTSGAVPYGKTTWAIQLDNVHLPDFTALGTHVGDTIVQELDRVYEITAWKTVAGFYYEVVKGGLGASTGLPTLISAAVPTFPLTRIDLTWSVPMSATISAAAAFAISAAHTISAHSIVDSLHTFLTVVEPFTVGESRTLAYAQPITNKMQDLSGNLVDNFSGYPISVGGGSGYSTGTFDSPDTYDY